MNLTTQSKNRDFRHFRFKDTNRLKVKNMEIYISCKQQPQESWTGYTNTRQNRF